LKIGVFQEIRENVLSGKPYQAHGWFIARQNPIDSLPDRARTIEAFSQLDFIVTVSIIPNDTEWYADVILPEASYLERYDPLLVLGNKAFLRQPVIEPIGDTRSALWIYKHLGARLGLSQYFQYTDEVDYINQQLAPLGVTVDDIKLKGYYEAPLEESAEVALDFKFNTPSGKIEIASETLRKAGQPAVPTWIEPPAPESDRFYLLTGKVGQHTQFSTQNNLWLNQVYPENSLWIHPQAAAERGINNGDTVKVASDRGTVEITATVTQGIRPDCVYMNQGWGKISKGLQVAVGIGASDSDLHLTFTDPVSGGQALTQTFVQVEKA
jgi:thiosulfate reductase/polysulfide reductase chain A